MAKAKSTSSRTFAIGDLQGCLDPLLQLLTKIEYDPNKDTLWFTGDLVNRGPQPLETLRYLLELPNIVCVLGNHDLALLAAASNVISLSQDDTMSVVLDASDSQSLLTWLRQLPILHHDPHLKFTLTHAGIYPKWDLAMAQSLAREVENALRGDQYENFLGHMYGNQPANWTDKLSGWDRLRFIINAFTRMRFCTKAGELELQTKGEKAVNPEHIPWYAFPERKTQQEKLLFGHWAALQGKCEGFNVYALDSGCVWGHCLTALCLETEQRFTIDCHGYINKHFPSR